MKIKLTDQLTGFRKRLVIKSEKYEEDSILEKWYEQIINKIKELNLK